MNFRERQSESLHLLLVGCFGRFTSLERDAQFDDSASDTSQASHPTHVMLQYDVILAVEIVCEVRRGPAGGKLTVSFSTLK